MLNILYALERDLPKLLADESKWKSLLIDYHPPRVERLWREWYEYRVYLHRIHPCTREEALFHPHPWSSAIRIVSGTYEMGVGYASGDTPPPAAATLMLGPGSAYEMIHPDGWHYVRPIGVPSLSVMVTGTPWGRSAPKSDTPLKELPENNKAELFSLFRTKY